MMRKLVAKLKKNRERGNTLAFVIILFPLVMACFGLAIDIAVQALTQTSLQNAADASTQSVISQSRNAFANGKPGLTQAEARSNFIKLYDANRKSGYSGTGATNNTPFVSCQGTAGGGQAIASGCGFQLTAFRYDANGAADAIQSNITITVHEESQTLFLRIIGIDHFEYDISSTARITQSYLPR